MDPIMIGIAAVVILVIFAGIFLMKKGKTSTTIDSQANTKRPKTLAEQQRELELQRQSQSATLGNPLNFPPSSLQPAHTTSPTQELQAAEQFIQNQDYTGAITILHRAVKTHPTRTDLYFTLLNTYALAKDYQQFNAFYPEVLALNDFDLTTRANNLKHLVDEEQSIHTEVATISQPINTKPSNADDLDFDLLDFNPDSNQSTPKNPAPVTTVETPATTRTAHPSANVDSQTNNDLDFDFELDTLQNKSASTAVSANEATATKPQAEALSVDGFDFELADELADKTVTPPTPAVASHTEILTPTSTASATPATTAMTADKDNLDADFDFDFTPPDTKSTATAAATMPPVVNREPTTPVTEKITDNVDNDFDFALIETPAAAAPVAKVSPSVITDHTPADEFTVDALDSHDIAKVAPDHLTTQPATNTSTVSHDDAVTAFDIDDDWLLPAAPVSTPTPVVGSAESTAAAMPVTEPVVATVQAPTAPTTSDTLKISDDMVDFALDDELLTTHESPVTNTTAQPTAADDDFEWTFDAPTTSQPAPVETPSTVTDSATAATAPIVETLSSLFDVIKDIDTDALNVDLAEQYLNLGEYDSAKRLLDEINTTDDAALLARANALRQRIV